MNKCVDIVVTYNRKKLLEENINALLNQTYKEHDVMIIDNASTDGTRELIETKFRDKVIYHNTEKNIGGAGGFAFGLEKAIKTGYEYAWIMDDDSIPEEGALESLIEKAQNVDSDFSFLASLVYWTDGEIFPMNIPGFNYRKKINARFDLIRKYKIMPIDTCSFVGCFINLKFAKKTALPIAEFFIYGDDIEYTERLRKMAPAYLDLDSVIIHKAPTNAGAEISLADETRLDRFYLQSRNGMYIARRNHKICKRIKVIFKRLARIIIESPNKKLKRSWILLKGTISGIFFNPKLKYVEEVNSQEEKDEN